MIFEGLIGNNKIKNELRETIKSNNILHSYLFIGDAGIGKKLFARQFAKAILCLNEQKACGRCDSCIKFDGGNNPDYKEIEPDGNSLKISQIRELQGKIYEKPISSNKKVIVIDDSDKMTEEAQNSLLKTLEEPPEYAVIILVATNENKLLNTIKSRCLKINFLPIESSEIKQYIINKQMQLLSDNILKLCNGSLGKITKILEDIEPYNEVEKSTLMLIGGNIKNIINMFSSFQVLYDNKEIICDLLDYMIVLMYNEILKNPLVSDKWINSINAIDKAKIKLNGNANFDMCIDEMLLNIEENM